MSTVNKHVNKENMICNTKFFESNIFFDFQIFKNTRRPNNLIDSKDSNSSKRRKSNKYGITPIKDNKDPKEDTIFKNIKASG